MRVKAPQGGNVELEEWLRLYRRVWVDKDYSRETIERLFTPRASLRPRALVALEEPYIGIDVIHDYIARVLPQVDIESMEFAKPLLDGSRAAVEAWLYGSLFGQVVTEAMCIVLRFDSRGRCEDLRDYPQAAEGIEKPYLGWSTYQL